MPHSPKDKGKDTQGISVTLKQEKGTVPLRKKEAKRCRSLQKRRVMYEIKGNNKEAYCWWKSIVWQSKKIKWESSTGKLKDMCGSPHMEKGGDIQQGERKYGSESLRHLR